MKKLALAAFALTAAASAASAAVALQAPAAPAPAPVTTPPPPDHVYCTAFGGRKYYVSNVFESDWRGGELSQEYTAFLRTTYGSSIDDGICIPYATRAEADAARRESGKGMFLVYRAVDVAWTPQPAPRTSSPSAPPAPAPPPVAPAAAQVATPGAGASGGAPQTSLRGSMTMAELYRTMSCAELQSELDFWQPQKKSRFAKSAVPALRQAQIEKQCAASPPAAAASPVAAAPAAAAHYVYCYYQVEARRRYWTSQPVATAVSASRDLAGEFGARMASAAEGHPSKAWCKTGDDHDKLLAEWWRDREMYSASGKVVDLWWEPARD